MKHQSLTYLLILLLNYSLWGQTANFVNVSSSAGINYQGDNYGVAVADYDNDGDDDIYVTIQNGVANKLYQNNGNAIFTDVAAEVGVADTGDGIMSVWADIDNDGDADLYVGNRDEPDKLYLNENGSFTDITFLSGIYNPAQPRSLNFADIDNDGDLDLSVANILAENRLFRNNGNNTFIDIIDFVGMTDPQLSMGAIFFDYNNDNAPDLYLTHDADQTFKLYENDGAGNFDNVAAEANADIEAQGMGVDIADFNLDGHMDLYITNLYENTLLLNNGDETFSDISASAGIEDLGMGWGILCFDYDNDGYPDIYINNESNIPPMESNKLYRNNGDNTFDIIYNGTISSNNPGIGAAFSDFNNDGLMDIFIANRGSSGNQLFLNQDSVGNNWIKLKMEGTVSNKDGIGARINVSANGKNYTDEVTSGSGYASQNTAITQLGLGSAENIDLITVLWPSGIIDSLTNVLPNQKLIIVEGETPEIPDTTGTTGLLHQELDVLFSFKNPSSKNIMINYKMELNKDLEIQIFNISGQKLYQEKIKEIEGQVYWSAPKSGYYFIQLKSGDLHSVKPIVVY